MNFFRTKKFLVQIGHLGSHGVLIVRQSPVSERVPKKSQECKSFGFT